MSGNALKKVAATAVKTATVNRMPLKVPRAVTAAEAPFVEPAKESTKTTLQPWRGWLSSILRDKLGEERFQSLRKLALFSPDDIHDLNQIPYPSTKVPVNNEGTEFAQFRYPSPGSQGPVRIPTMEPGEDPYDTAYYKRDTARRYRNHDAVTEADELRLALMDPNDPDVKELQAKIAAGPTSSPGNKGRFATGPTDFDPTGLRAAMSANHEALNKSLDAHMPDHIPYPEWYDRHEEFEKWYEDRGLPIPAGATGFGTVPTEARVARW